MSKLLTCFAHTFSLEVSKPKRLAWVGGESWNPLQGLGEKIGDALADNKFRKEKKEKDEGIPGVTDLSKPQEEKKEIKTEQSPELNVSLDGKAGEVQTKLRDLKEKTIEMAGKYPQYQQDYENIAVTITALEKEFNSSFADGNFDDVANKVDYIEKSVLPDIQKIVDPDSVEKKKEVKPVDALVERFQKLPTTMPSYPEYKAGIEEQQAILQNADSTIAQEEEALGRIKEYVEEAERIAKGELGGEAPDLQMETIDARPFVLKGKPETGAEITLNDKKTRLTQIPGFQSGTEGQVISVEKGAGKVEAHWDGAKKDWVNEEGKHFAIHGGEKITKTDRIFEGTAVVDGTSTKAKNPLETYPLAEATPATTEAPAKSPEELGKAYKDAVVSFAEAMNIVRGDTSYDKAALDHATAAYNAMNTAEKAAGKNTSDTQRILSEQLNGNDSLSKYKELYSVAQAKKTETSDGGTASGTTSVLGGYPLAEAPKTPVLNKERAQEVLKGKAISLAKHLQDLGTTSQVGPRVDAMLKSDPQWETLLKTADSTKDAFKDAVKAEWQRLKNEPKKA